MSFGNLARALTLLLVAASATGCCQAIGTACDCINCLTSGPRLPGALGQAQLAQAREIAAPTVQRASMRY